MSVRRPLPRRSARQLGAVVEPKRPRQRPCKAIASKGGDDAAIAEAALDLDGRALGVKSSITISMRITRPPP